MSLPMPPSGHNGLNETKIGLSSSVALSFFDNTRSEIPIQNSRKQIEILIPREKTCLIILILK